VLAVRGTGLSLRSSGISVRTSDGNLHEATLTEPTGSSAAGGDARDALLQKFMRLASARIGADRAQCVPELIDNLERHRVTELVRLIA